MRNLELSDATLIKLKLIFSAIFGLIFGFSALALIPLDIQFIENIIHPSQYSTTFFGFASGLVILPPILTILCVRFFIKNLRTIRQLKKTSTRRHP